MDSVTEKRRRIIISVLYYGLILAAFYLIFKTFFSILIPFIVAFILAAILHRPVKYVSGKTPLNRSVTSTIFVLLILAALGSLVFLIGNALFGKVKDFYDYILNEIKDFPTFAEKIKTWAISIIGFLPDKIRAQLTENITVFFEKLIDNGFSDLSISSISSIGIDWSSLLAKGGGVLKNTVVQIPSVLIAIVVSVVACVFITIDYDHILSFVMRQFSDRNKKRIKEAKSLAIGTLSGMLKAYSIIVLITATELSIGFYILHFAKIFQSDYIIFISILIAIVDIIPVLGTGTILIPWTIYSFISGDIAMGIGLLVMYVAITVIRQIIEPKLVAGQAGLSPIVTIIAMYVGAKTLGIFGFFILPFCVILINKFNEAGIIHLFKNPEKEEKTSAHDDDSADGEQIEAAPAAVNDAAE